MSIATTRLERRWMPLPIYDREGLVVGYGDEVDVMETTIDPPLVLNQGDSATLTTTVTMP